MDGLLDFIKKQNADVYLFQEVFDGKDSSLDRQYRSMEVFSDQLGLPHQHFAPSFIEDLEDGNKVIQGNAIFSRFPLKEISMTYYDVPFGIRENNPKGFEFTPRSLQHVVAQVDNKQLHLLNTQGIWGEHGRDTPRRVAMAEHILREVGTHDPLVLAGDFNVQPRSKTVEMLENALTSVFKDELETSFNVKRKDLVASPGYATAVVDMVYVSQGVKVLAHECPVVDISDHLPLVVEVSLL